MRTKKNPELRKYSDLVSRVRIEHDVYENIFTELVDAYESVGYTATPICLLITGETRTGKSSVVQDLLERFLSTRVEHTGVQSIVYAVAPAKATLKSLLEALLKGLGDPFWSRGTESSMTQRLYTMLDAVKCRMIILDEFQHICDKGQAKKLDVLADWLKVLIESKKYALVAVGLPVAASVVYGHNQLVGRFDDVLRMPLFDWKNAASVAQFRGVLRQFERELHPFELPPLHTREMALRIYLATAGRIGLVAKLLDRVVRNAIRGETTKIRMEDFAKAYVRAIWSAQRFPIEGGPFGAELELLSGDAVRMAVLRNAAMESVADESAAVSVHGSKATAEAPSNASDARQSRASSGASKRKAGGRRPSNGSKVQRDLARAL
jgi:hypothetical protein